MGNVFGHFFYEVAERIGLKAEANKNAKKEREWLKNPEIRKLVPTPKCPHCKCRLDGLDGSDSDSDVKVKASQECRSEISAEDMRIFHVKSIYSDSVISSEAEVEEKLETGMGLDLEVNMRQRAKVAIQIDTVAGKGFGEDVPFYIE